MGRSIGDVRNEQVKLYGTKDNIYGDFPIGTHVKIICPSQDHYFFYGETGKVIRNKGEYLSIIVEFDKPRHFKNGYIQTEFNFNPEDLTIWNAETKVMEKEENRLKKLGKEERAKEEEQSNRSERFEIMDL